MAFSKKVVLIGDSSVGKTSLIRRFVLDSFDDSYITTIGAKVSKKDLLIHKDGQNVPVTLMIWDVIGTQGYTSMHARTFAGVHGAIIVADLTRKETLQSIGSYWIPNLKLVVEDVPMVFACNKADLKDKASFSVDEMKTIASRFNIGVAGVLPADLKTCYLTSAKTAENVNGLFESLARMMIADKREEDPTKAIFESIIATGMATTSDKSTLIGTLDAILVDVAEAIGDEKKAMDLVSDEVRKVGIDVKRPTKEGLTALVGNIQKAERMLLNTKKAKANRDKRMKWIAGAK